MTPQPKSIDPDYKAARKLEKKVAIITGDDTPLGRAGQPEEIVPCFVFLASDDSSYMTGQILHPNGGEIING